MKFTALELPDVVLIEPKVFGDARGFFMETWEKKKFAAGGVDAEFVQDNHSASGQWVLRGLHYQITRPQGKLVRVISGAVFDVAVDLRRSSATLGRWAGAVLSAENKHMIWVPPGFAHGFLTLTERVEFVYKCTEFYDPADERVLAWNDSRVGVEWPLPPAIQPQLSARDSRGADFARCEKYA